MWDVPRTYSIYKYVNRSPDDQDSSKTEVVGGYCLLTSPESSSSKTLVLCLLFSRAWSSSTRALAVQAMAQVYQFQFKQAWSPGQINQVWEGFSSCKGKKNKKKKGWNLSTVIVIHSVKSCSFLISGFHNWPCMNRRSFWWFLLLVEAF
jgi:hypothetical protein